MRIKRSLIPPDRIPDWVPVPEDTQRYTSDNGSDVARKFEYGEDEGTCCTIPSMEYAGESGCLLPKKRNGTLKARAQEVRSDGDLGRGVLLERRIRLGL